jgi:misacylated tRNA(Ala) deacylase
VTEELFRDDAYLRSCEAEIVAAGTDWIELDRTVFYPMGGGQPGDRGELTFSSGETLFVLDTRTGETPGTIVHVVESVPEAVLGAKVTVSLDWERRHRLMRMHSCMHLLCAVIDGGVTGGAIRDGSARLDFDLPDQLLNKDAITERLNALVAADANVKARWISEDELDAAPELVRTMSVQPPRGQGRVRILDIDGIDLQPCGGTHIARTSEIGGVRVKKIEKKGKHNRRVNVVFDEM